MIASLYEEHRQEIHQRWGIPLENITVIPNGVDETRFADRHSQALAPSENLPAEPFGLFVGRLEPRKGAHVLLDAVRRIGVPCVIVGDGPERSALAEAASNLGVTDKVTFAGSIQNGQLKEYYARAHFFVLPSLSEALPLTVLEAMACGVPIVASSVGALPSLVEANRCGILCTPGDAEDLAEKMSRILDDSTLADSLGRNGRNSVLQGFTWDIIALKTEALYRQMAARSAETAPARAANPVGDVLVADRDDSPLP
jgi:glycosyltransferase involved in cell wall biosynthesis